MPSPLHTVKNDFGSKEALVDQLIPLLERLPEESDIEFKDRLLRVSNRKLLRLWSREQDIQARFGDRGGLIDKIIELRGVSAASRPALENHSTGRLLSMHWGLERAARRG